MSEALHTTVLVIHVLGATLIIGTAFATSIIELKKYSSQETLKLTEFMWKLAGPTMGIQLITGFYLAGSEWGEIRKVSFFWIKMFLFFVVGGMVGYINKKRFASMKKGQKQVGSVNWTIIGLLTFMSIAALGVLIAESV